MTRLRLLTSGESHGPALSGVLDGLPAGMPVSTDEVNRDLWRRQQGYGAGLRMTIEQDAVTWTAGIRFGRTLGSPVGFTIPNRDWEKWTRRMSVEQIPVEEQPKPIVMARPGHADLAGAIKYDTDDIRDVLERASARSTAPRVAAGAICRQLLAACGVRIWSFADQMGTIRAFPDTLDTAEAVERVPAGWQARDRVEPSPLRCPDPSAEAEMIALVDDCKAKGDTIGGSFVVVAEGMPIGVGSNAEWDQRLDAQLAGAVMGIQAVKGVEIGIGFGVVERRGTAVHDEVIPGEPGWRRRTNRAGGTEGGMSNGAPIIVRAAVKPVATLLRPLDSVNLIDGTSERAHIERSDVAILPRAAVVGEMTVAFILADAILATFGGDTLGDLLAAVDRRRERSRGPRGERRVHGTGDILPDNAAEAAKPVPGADA